MEQEIKFEKALERLEKIVEDLESGNMPLEDALKKYEEGVKLSRLCTAQLAQAETKIQTLTRALDGTLEDTPLDQGEGAKRPERSRSSRGVGEGKKAKKPGQIGDAPEDDLLV